MSVQMHHYYMVKCIIIIIITLIITVVNIFLIKLTRRFRMMVVLCVRPARPLQRSTLFQVM